MGLSLQKLKSISGCCGVDAISQGVKEIADQTLPSNIIPNQRQA